MLGKGATGAGGLLSGFAGRGALCGGITGTGTGVTLGEGLYQLTIGAGGATGFVSCAGVCFSGNACWASCFLACNCLRSRNMTALDLVFSELLGRGLCRQWVRWNLLSPF